MANSFSFLAVLFIVGAAVVTAYSSSRTTLHSALHPIADEHLPERNQPFEFTQFLELNVQSEVMRSWIGADDNNTTSTTSSNNNNQTVSLSANSSNGGSSSSSSSNPSSNNTTSTSTTTSAPSTNGTASGSELNTPQKPRRAGLPNHRHIDGRIRLNGVRYNTACQCDDATAARIESKLNLTECFAPVRLRVKQEHFNKDRGLSKTMLLQLLGKPADHRATIFEVKQNTLKDIDGRIQGPHLATPGGELSEFISALNEYERIIKQKLTYKEVSMLLRGWLDWSNRPPVVFATDLQSVEHLRKHLRVRGEAGTVVDLDLVNPPDDYKPGLRQDLRDGRNHGSRYIKALINSPTRFALRPQLAQDVIVAFFETMWDSKTERKNGQGLLSSQCKLDIVEGTAEQEKAWINFRSNRHCEHELKAPAFKGNTEVANVFINHPEAVQYVRHRLSQFFAHHASTLGIDVPALQFFLKFQRRGLRNLQMAAELLGRDVPFYHVTVE